MSSPCGGITVGASYSCSTPIVAGVEDRLVLINKEDISSYTESSNVITAITLAASATAFAFQGARQSVNPQSQMVAQTRSIGYDHQVGFLVFEIDQAQKDNLEKMALSKLVAIVENINVAGNGDAVFEVFGKNVGLEVSELIRINSDLESNGAYSLVLKTSDDAAKEPKLPQSLWDTDYATTKAIVDALLP